MEVVTYSGKEELFNSAGGEAGEKAGPKAVLRHALKSPNFFISVEE